MYYEYPLNLFLFINFETSLNCLKLTRYERNGYHFKATNLTKTFWLHKQPCKVNGLRIKRGWEDTHNTPCRSNSRLSQMYDLRPMHFHGDRRWCGNHFATIISSLGRRKGRQMGEKAFPGENDVSFSRCRSRLFFRAAWNMKKDLRLCIMGEHFSSYTLHDGRYFQADEKGL